MLRQCAWCLEMMGEVSPVSDTSVTHGICDKCQEELMKKIEQTKEMRKAS